MIRTDHTAVIMCLRCGWRRASKLLRHAQGDVAAAIAHPVRCAGDIVCRWRNPATGLISGGVRKNYEVR